MINIVKFLPGKFIFGFRKLGYENDSIQFTLQGCRRENG
jgi:hypothetical protein